MKKKKIFGLIFLILYLTGGCWFFFAPTVGYGGAYVKKALRHGLLRQVWISTSEAYLSGTNLYIKGVKKVISVREKNNEDMYLKYDLALQRVTGRERSPITVISASEYIKNRNNDTMFKFVDYDLYESNYNERNKCSTDSFYGTDGKYIFIDGNRTKRQDRHILITNEHVNTSVAYYNECKFTPKRLEYSLPTSRAKSAYMVFCAKFAGGLTLDFLTWPIQLFAAIFSPG
ncbi:hypothetical protein DSOUD_0999 [Desulfuromonas soudanensis]|uniref:Lipoprotein n=1 Tax=Desulfuromonas soudanensis TaxID=1603606 RepID=A0A0M4D525_9BACT|nr:hypothetical protein [Desulfuromonas soudanensis]ALC15785.1 hypothetical protein DSOUD_0999 [Desulfuromonas soudanensis]